MVQERTGSEGRIGVDEPRVGTDWSVAETVTGDGIGKVVFWDGFSVSRRRPSGNDRTWVIVRGGCGSGVEVTIRTHTSGVVVGQ